MTDQYSYTVDLQTGLQEVEHDPRNGYVHANHSGIACTTGQLVPANWPGYEEQTIVYVSREEAAAINAVLRSRQWSPTSCPDYIDTTPAIWDVAVRHGFAQPGEREGLLAAMGR